MERVRSVTSWIQVSVLLNRGMIWSKLVTFPDPQQDPGSGNETRSKFVSISWNSLPLMLCVSFWLHTCTQNLWTDLSLNRTVFSLPTITGSTCWRPTTGGSSERVTRYTSSRWRSFRREGKPYRSRRWATPLRCTGMWRSKFKTLRCLFFRGMVGVSKRREGILISSTCCWRQRSVYSKYISHW